MELLSLTGPSWLAALVVVAVGALGTAAVVIGRRAWRDLHHERKVRRILGRLKKRPRVEGAESEATLSVRKVARASVRWLEPVMHWLPRRENLQRLLVQAGERDRSVSHVVAWMAIAGSVICLPFVIVHPMLGAAAFVLGALIPLMRLRRRRTKRVEAFESNFPSAIDQLARSLKAGHSFSTGLKVAADEAAPPVDEEFRQVFEEQKFGRPLRGALTDLTRRIDSLDVRMFVTAVLVQRETGGNLVENLSKLSNVMRERFQFHRQLGIYMAKARTTSYILAAAPILAALAMWLFDPTYIGRMFAEPLGRVMVGVAITFQVVGFIVMQKMTNIEY